MRLEIKIASVAAVAMWSLSGCGKHEESRRPRAEETPVQVKVAEVRWENRAQFQEITGTVQAKVRAVLEAKTSGRIEKISAVLGQKVSKGEVVVLLDAPEVEAKVDQAKASLELAGTELKRATSLFQQEALTRAEYEAAEARYRVAEASAREAGSVLGYSKVMAPFDGIVAQKFVEVGDLAVPGKALVELQKQGEMRFIAEIPESLMPGMKGGEELRVEIAGSEPVKGQVVEIAPGSDPVSRTSRVELRLPEGPYRSGVFGRLLAPMRSGPVMSVPASAIIERGQLEIVYIVQTNHLRMRLVKTGKRLQEQVEIISGLTEGDRVVWENSGMLREGQPVRSL